MSTQPLFTMLPIKKVQSLALNKIREFHPESEQYQNIKRSIARNGFYTTCPIYVRPLRNPETKEVTSTNKKKIVRNFNWFGYD